MATADSLKAEGNKAFAAKNWDAAIDLFSQAIELDPKNHVLWSNRSAAKAGKKDWPGALSDADERTHHGARVICERVRLCMGRGSTTKLSQSMNRAHQWKTVPH
ncbi:hypothetical protein FA15DRAFT_398561 [Coprinopsis marcescibilis]|uniref:Uncharacterized protein n=1 Tax=Coprinopsis marcescibilis TaxID=230819 RepID=A0A5C3L938_COPMA|nr:hypothetical protein FA15DRAFT_398561 [Coprinopsis marcescibilis]